MAVEQSNTPNSTADPEKIVVRETIAVMAQVVTDTSNAEMH
jgi:hypothetical protein